MPKKFTPENESSSVESGDETRTKVIDILQRVGMAEAQANLIFPQVRYFIEIVELHTLLSLMRESKLSWYRFLTSIPEEPIQNEMLYKAYLKAHEHYGIQNKLSIDNHSMSLPSVNKLVRVLYRIFHFMSYMMDEKYCVSLPGEPILTPALVTQMGMQMDKFSVYFEYQELFARMEDLIKLQRDFIFSPGMKVAGKLVKEIYAIKPGQPDYFRASKYEVRDDELDKQSAVYYRDVFFRAKFADPEFISLLRSYLERAFPQGEMRKMLIPCTYKRLLKTNSLDNPYSLSSLIKKVEQNKLWKLLLAEGFDENAVRLLMSSLYFQPSFAAKEYLYKD